MIHNFTKNEVSTNLEENKHIITSKSLDNLIQSVERDFFIGRTDELDFFKNPLHFPETDINVLHIHGMGGVGKSYLLNEFTRIFNPAFL